MIQLLYVQLTHYRGQSVLHHGRMPDLRPLVGMPICQFEVWGALTFNRLTDRKISSQILINKKWLFPSTLISTLQKRRKYVNGCSSCVILGFYSYIRLISRLCRAVQWGKLQQIFPGKWVFGKESFGHTEIQNTFVSCWVTHRAPAAPSRVYRTAICGRFVSWKDFMFNL